MVVVDFRNWVSNFVPAQLHYNNGGVDVVLLSFYQVFPVQLQYSNNGIDLVGLFPWRCNIHVDLPNVSSRLFMDFLQTFDLQQHVSFAIHIQGHWLNLCITRLICSNIKSVLVALMDYQITIL